MYTPAKSVLVAAGLLAFASIVPTALGQTVQGDLVGAVRDSQGAAIPKAQVRITNEGTGAVRELESDERGDFLAIGFFVGSYRVEVEKEGFKKRRWRESMSGP